MTALNKSNIFLETWRNIHSVISGNITDPESRDKRWILGTFPNLEGRNFPEYPLIIIENPMASSDSLSFTTSEILRNTVDTSIYVYAKDPAQLNGLCGSVYHHLFNSKASMLTSGLQLEEIRTGIDGQDLHGNQLIHFKEQVASCSVVT